jgi:hypothetical protein
MDNITEIKTSIENIENAIEIKNNPLVKATILSLLKLIPILGELIDGTTDALLLEFQKRKREELLKVILSKNEYITYERVNDVEFIMNFAKTVEAVNRLSDNSKVKYFGNLLRNSYFSRNKIKNDDFEENLYFLNNMISSDLEILESLRLNYKKLPLDVSNAGKEFELALEETITGIVEDLKLTRDSVISTLDKLSGMGLCTKTIYYSFTYGTCSADVHYGVSPLYEKLRKFILEF